MTDFPSQQPLPPVAPPPLDAGTYSFSKAFEVGFALFTRRYGLLVAVSGFIFGMSIVDSIVGGIIQQIAVQARLPALMILRLLWAILFGLGVTLPLNAAILMPAIKAIRSGGSGGVFADVFLGYKRYLNILLYLLIIIVVTTIALVPLIGIIVALGATQADPEVVLVVIIGTVLIYLPVFIFFGTRLFYVYTIILDTAWGQPNVIEAIKGSWTITRGHFWSLFALSLCCGILLIASFFLLCVGIFLVGYPIYMGVMGAAYVQLARAHVGTGETPGIPDVCARCGYPLRPNDTVCPECGTPRNLFGPRSI